MQISPMIRKRISNIPCDKENLKQSAPDYNNAFKGSSFNEKINFARSPPERKGSRNILWLNPRLSSNVQTNIGKLFLRLLEKHFLKHDKYYKLFKRNNIKISYSCIQNMVSVTQNINTNILKDPAAPTGKECSCQQKSNCSLAEKYLTECLVYYAQVDTSDINEIKNYYGTCKKKLQRTLEQP